MSGGRLLLLRHGPTEWSEAGRHTGRSDIPLTEHGRTLVTNLAPMLTGWRPALTLCSPLQRAWETAKLAGFTPLAEPDLLEWDYGAYEGITSAQIQTQRVKDGEPPWSLWTDGCPGGETAEAVGARVDRVLARAASTMASEADVALIAHGHVLRVLSARWLGLPPHQGALLMLDAGRACVLDREHGVAAIRVWNAGPSALTP